MDQPVVAQNAPYPIEVEAGKSYFWCACGKSGQQPFCDGSHQGTSILPERATKASREGLFWATLWRR